MTSPNHPTRQLAERSLLIITLAFRHTHPRPPLSGAGKQSFAEYAPEPNPETKKKDVVWLVWFAINEDRPPFAFAGI
jgi:hypothetical protein